MKYIILGKDLFDRKKTIKQKINLILSYLHLKFRNLYLYNYPVSFVIDPCNCCNLKCALCPTRKEDKDRKRSFMNFNIFKKIIDECGDYLWDIILYSWGEPLLNKDIFEIIKYARKRKIDIALSTNLNNFNDEICINLIRSGLNTLAVSLDGASQETVIKYQKGNNFNLVMNNIERLISMKEKLKSRTPIIEWRYVVNKYNENEIKKAQKIAEKLKIYLNLNKLWCDMGNILVSDQQSNYESVKSWLPKDERLSMYDYSKKQRRDIKKFCNLLWVHSTIQSDGGVTPCCAVWHDKFDFGNIKNSSFKAIWNNEDYKNARRIIKGEHLFIKNNICYICKKNKAIISY